MDIITLQELLIKYDDDLVVCLPDHCSSQSEGNVLSLGWIDVDDSVTHLVVLGSLDSGVRTGPEGELLLEDFVVHEELVTSAIELDGLIVLFDNVLVLI